MIRTKQKSRYCLLALLALLAVSCQKEEIVSTKDTLPWTINQHMDAENYRPGDDFYLYCNGKYWNNAPMGKVSPISTKTISFQVTTSGPFDIHEEYKAGTRERCGNEHGPLV